MQVIEDEHVRQLDSGVAHKSHTLVADIKYYPGGQDMHFRSDPHVKHPKLVQLIQLVPDR